MRLNDTKELVTKMIKERCYSELIKIPTFKERYRYLRLEGIVGEFTFNGHRALNQALYRSPEWKSFRRRVAIRDDGCDLACPDHKISGSTRLIIHHINPLTIEDIANGSPAIFDMENVITTIMNTHQAIHYGDESLLIDEPIIRTQGDTCPWR